MIENKDSKLIRRTREKEIVFFIAVLLKMVVQTVSMSVIPVMVGQELCRNVFKIMTYSSYLLVIVSFVLNPYFKARELITIAIIVAVSVVGSYFSGNEIMLTMIYIYGAKNISIEKTVKRLSICYILIFLCIVAGSQIGIVEDWDFFAGTDRPRWGLGYTYPTHTSSVLFMVILLYCYLRKRNLKIIEVFLILLLDYWVYKKTDSRAGALLSAMVPILFIFLRLCKKKTYQSKIAWLLQWAFPVCGLLIFFLTINYKDQGIYKTINSLLSSRLYYSQYSMRTYGVHLFGQKIEWVGWGGIGHIQKELTGVYNFVDTSYLKLLLENGIIVWALIMFAWTCTSINAYRKSNMYLLWSLGTLAVYCMAEQWLMNLGANPFVLFLSYPVFQYKHRITKAERKQEILLSKINNNVLRKILSDNHGE